MPPTKLSHVVFQTNRKKAMQEWYCQVLEGHVAFEDAHLAFMTYDDEHHRVAFVDFGPLAPRDRSADMAVPPSDPPGLHHVAFTFGSMGDLLANYTRLAARGITVERSFGNIPEIYANPLQLEQVFINLATNARDAIDAAGRGKGTIRIHTRSSGNFIEILFREVSRREPLRQE